MRLRDGVESHWQERRCPTSVAAACAEAGNVSLDDRDSKRWVGLTQIVGRPHAGVSGADDGDIDIDIAGKTGSLLEVILSGQGVVPE